jgi:hypothetical protein
MIHFTVTQDHIDVLRSQQFVFVPNERDNVFPHVSNHDGASSVRLCDLADALDIEPNRNSDDLYTPDEMQRIKSAYWGINYTLQILIHCGEVTPGKYYSVMGFNDWVRVASSPKADKVPV